MHASSAFLGVVLFFIFAEAGSTWNIRQRLATHTMYSPRSEFSEPPPTCKPVQVNLVARHGARFPGAEDIRKYSILQEKMNRYAGLYAPPYAWMGTWKNPYGGEGPVAWFPSNQASSSCTEQHSDPFRTGRALQLGSAHDQGVGRAFDADLPTVHLRIPKHCHLSCR